MISVEERHKSQRAVLFPRLWAAVKGLILRPLEFKTSVAIVFAVLAALLSVLFVYLEIHDWMMMAFFFSLTLELFIGAALEEFKVKHWSLSYLAILSITLSFLSFLLVQVSMLSLYPLAVIGWMVFALPPLANISYNLLMISKVQQPRNL